jgi:hypothetical protein
MGEVVEFPKIMGHDKDKPAEDVLVSHARELVASMAKGVDGFFIAVVGPDGKYNAGWRVPPTMSETMFGALMGEITRREIITQTEAVFVFNRASETTYDDGA